MKKTRADLKRENSGFVLPAVITAVIILTLTGLAFVYMSETRRIEVNNRIAAARAFWLAEAGLERGKRLLINEFSLSGTWVGLDEISGYEIENGPDNDEFYSFIPPEELGNGTYEVSLRNIPDGTGGSVSYLITVRSTGESGGVRRTVESEIEAVDFAPGESSIFGAGAAGNPLTGNVILCGSIYVGGEGYGEDDVVLVIGGNARILNHYENIGNTNYIKNHIPEPPTVLYNGVPVKTLRSNVWVRRGKVEMSGTGRIGAEGTPDGFRGKVDGVYLPRGEDDLVNERHINSVRGIGRSTLYDPIEFPDSNQYNQEFIQNPGTVVIPGHVTIRPGEIVITELFDPDYEFDEDCVVFNIDDYDNLIVNGRVFVEGNLTFESIGPAAPIWYSGRGTILANGTAEIRNSIVTTNFRVTNILALITEGDIKWNAPHLEVMGVLYSHSGIEVSNPGGRLAGSIGTSGDFTVNNPFTIYQVPNLSGHLSQHIVAYTHSWRPMANSWRLVTE